MAVDSDKLSHFNKVSPWREQQLLSQLQRISGPWFLRWQIRRLGGTRVCAGPGHVVGAIIADIYPQALAMMC